MFNAIHSFSRKRQPSDSLQVIEVVNNSGEVSGVITSMFQQLLQSGLHDKDGYDSDVSSLSTDHTEGEAIQRTSRVDDSTSDKLEGDIKTDNRPTGMYQRTKGLPKAGHSNELACSTNQSTEDNPLESGNPNNSRTTCQTKVKTVGQPEMAGLSQQPNEVIEMAEKSRNLDIVDAFFNLAPLQKEDGTRNYERSTKRVPTSTSKKITNLR